MDVKNISVRDGKDSSLPSVAHNIRILLVDHDKISLMSVASQLEKYFYKVTTTQSADDALSLFWARKNYYNIVIADLGMPEQKIYELVHKFQCQPKNIPVILMVEDQTMDLARKALDYGKCYLISKPLIHEDIVYLWHHIYKVTGEMPTSLIDTTFIDKEKHDISSSGSSCDGGASNQTPRNSKRKLIKTDIESIKRTKYQFAEHSNSSNGTEEDDSCTSKKSWITWTSSLHKKFLQAITILGKQRAEPETLLRMMNEPYLTIHHISSHLQEYRDQKGHYVNLQNSGGNFAGYTLAYVKEKLDSWNRERAGATSDVRLSSNDLQALNQELEGEGATSGVIPASGQRSNGLQALNRNSTGDSGIGMYGLGNAGDQANMNSDHVGEGSSSERA